MLTFVDQKAKHALLFHKKINNNISLVQSFSINIVPYSMIFYDNQDYLFICTNTGKLYIYDTSDPKNVSLVSNKIINGTNNQIFAIDFI